MWDYPASIKVEVEHVTPTTSDVRPRRRATRPFFFFFTFIHLRNSGPFFLLTEETKLTKSLVGWLNMKYILPLVTSVENWEGRRILVGTRSEHENVRGPSPQAHLEALPSHELAHHAPSALRSAGWPGALGRNHSYLHRWDSGSRLEVELNLNSAGTCFPWKQL